MSNRKPHWFAALLLLGTIFQQSSAVGGWKNVEDLEPKHQEIVDFALAEYVGASEGACDGEKGEVRNFKEQVVQGKLYKFDLVRNGKCSATGEEQTCHMVVWERAWMEPSKEIVWDKVKCTRNESSDEEIHLPRVPLQKSPLASSPILPQLRVGLVLPASDGSNKETIDHGVKLLGSGDHDYLPHGKRLIGKDEHDKKKHGHKKVFGGDDHDKKSHSLSEKEGKSDKKVHLLGGGDHDYLAHGKKVFGGKHDHEKHGDSNHKKSANKKKLLGGDDHDKKVHKKFLLGGKHHGPKFEGNYTTKELLSNEKSNKALKKLQSLDKFHQFMKEHKKVYNSKREFKKRYAVFRDNMKKVQFLRESEQGTGEYGITPFADLTEMEFKRQHTGLNTKRGDDPGIHWPAADIPDVELPDEFDWRAEGAVTEVKNQGKCGSCWAFSVTGNVEGQYAVKHGELLDLSEQELVDCDPRDNGCNGGLPENAYKTILEIGGLETEKDYGYDGEDEKCKFNRTKVAARVTGGVEISQNETEMAQWLFKNGPISVGLNAAAMQFYKGGVSHPWRFLCSPDGIDHGVLIVGFGVHDYPLFHKKLPFWIIKNSWGTGWGEQGYYRLYRGDGTCGINMMTSSAIVE